MFTQRNNALLMFKIDGDNYYQIEQALRSYCLLILSGHRYLKRITAAGIGRDRRIDILPHFLALRKNLHDRRIFQRRVSRC